MLRNALTVCALLCTFPLLPGYCGEDVVNAKYDATTDHGVPPDPVAGRLFHRASASDLLDQGTQLYAAGDFEAAIKKYKQAVMVGPSLNTFYNLALALKSNHDYDQATTALNKALRYAPKDADALALLKVIGTEKAQYKPVVSTLASGSEPTEGPIPQSTPSTTDSKAANGEVVPLMAVQAVAQPVSPAPSKAEKSSKAGGSAEKP